MAVSLHHSPTASHLCLGREGERIAERFLEHLGYRILDRNVRLGRDEIDLVAFDPVDQVRVFVEVKSRRSQSEEYPARMNASPFKIRKFQRAVDRWLAEHDEDGYVRLDLVCVEEGKVTEHFKEIGAQDGETYE